MSIKERIAQSVERLRFKYGPRAAEALVRLSAITARRRLRQAGPTQVLVDNTILAHAVTHETAWVPTGPQKWGPLDIDTGYAARIPVRRPDASSREYRNVRYLPGIAHLAREGHLNLMTSGELEIEQWRQPVGRFRGYGIFDHNLFAGLRLELVDDLPPMVFGSSWIKRPSLEEQQRKRLAESQDPLYLALLRLLGPSNSQDAWHIRTAEAHGMLCFLTMDFKLLRIVAEQGHQAPLRSLQTRIWAPEELAKHLGLLPVNPTLLSYTGASFPVRPDLHLPGNKRQKRRRRREGG